MELYLVLIAIMPGLIIYSGLRNEGYEKHIDDPEYIVLIRGIFYSMPFFALLLFYAGIIYPDKKIQESFEVMVWDYRNVILYFFAIIVYSRLVLYLAKRWRLNIKPELS